MKTMVSVLLALAGQLPGSQAFALDEQRCDVPLIAQTLRPQLPRQFPGKALARGSPSSPRPIRSKAI